MPSIYLERGYNTRREYLEALADDYGVPFDTVQWLASVLGEAEDFAGLLVALDRTAEII